MWLKRKQNGVKADLADRKTKRDSGENIQKKDAAHICTKIRDN